ncbi:hypothetical protein DFH06DRAFT_715357 [Mycena polygramma]|nr:hypothetical protein DFH06DRAFT_715357 [Mycena polygramma]
MTINAKASRSLLAEKDLPQRDNANQRTTFYGTTSLLETSSAAPTGSGDPNKIHPDTANQSCRQYKTSSNTASKSDDVDCSLSEDVNATKTIKRRDMLVDGETTSLSSHTATSETPGCCVSQMTSSSSASLTSPQPFHSRCTCSRVLAPLAGSDGVDVASPRSVLQTTQAATSLSSEAFKVSRSHPCLANNLLIHCRCRRISHSTRRKGPARPILACLRLRLRITPPCRRILRQQLNHGCWNHSWWSRRPRCG